MATGYYDNQSLLQGASTPQFDVGALLKGGATIQQSLGSIRDRELEDAKISRENKRFAREQELNARTDTEYNRELGLRTGRQDLAKEFLANPNANKFGGGRETTLLDQQVNDYVNKGGVIDDDMAKRLQSRYEEVRPFKEDATNALTSQMVLAGEDPTKAAQLGSVLGSNLPSRIDQQAKLDAYRTAQQDAYNKQAEAKLNADRLNTDIWKTNANMSNEQYLAKLKNGIAMFGGGSGSGGTAGGMNGKTYSDLDTSDLSPGGWTPTMLQFDSKEAQAAANKANADGIPAAVFLKAYGNSIDKSGSDTTVNYDRLDQNVKALMSQYNKGQIGPQTTAPNYSANDYVAQIAPRQIVDYDPKKFLEGSKSVLPELFGKDAVAEKPLLSEAKSSTTETKSGTTLADRNNNWGNIKYDKGTEWQGGTEGEKGFVKFDTPELGARALAKTIMNGGVGKTVDQYINKYAPASDNNDTKSYINEVAKTLGKKPDERITLDDVPTLMQAIAKREGGNYSKDVLDAGYKMAVSPQLTEFHKAVNAKDGSANKLLADMSTKFNDKSIDWSNGTSNADVSPVTDLFGKVNTSRYGINAEVSRNNGGVGGENPDQKIAEQRIAEINSKLGANPAPTPENLALMDERSKLNPRPVGSKAMDYVDTLRRELIDPLGPSGYAVGGIPKIGTGLGRLGELLTSTTKPMVIEDAPKLLENLRPQGGANWTGTGRVTTDKLNGISADTVLGQAGNQGNKLAGALRNADESKRLLEETPQTNLSNLNYFSNTSLNKLNLQAPVDARRLLDGAIEARSKGQIDDAKLFEMIQKINDTKLLNPRELMEALDKIGFKR